MFPELFYPMNLLRLLDYQDYIEWFQMILDLGTDYVYYPKSKKTIVVIDPSDVAEGESYFNDLGVKVVTGQLYLDGIVMVKKSLKSM